jgi:hypothetical protein
LSLMRLVPYALRLSFIAPVAQGIEQLPSKQWVACSNQAGGTYETGVRQGKALGDTGPRAGGRQAKA